MNLRPHGEIEIEEPRALTRGLGSVSFELFAPQSGKGNRMGRFDEVYRRSLDDPEGFWAEAAAAIDWDEPWR